MMRGTNRQRIFHDDADYITFLDCLRKVREVSGFALYAHCLMSNHLHLLLRVHEDGEPLDKIMRRLGARYVYRYNRRYERSGALFDGRFKSEGGKKTQGTCVCVSESCFCPFSGGVIVHWVHDTFAYPFILSHGTQILSHAGGEGVAFFLGDWWRAF